MSLLSAPVLPSPNIAVPSGQSTLQQSEQELQPLPQQESTTTASLDKQGDLFWGDDPNILFDKTRLREFFPTVDQTLSEKMNAITRLVIYVSIALSVYQGKATAAHFGMLLMVILYFMWKTQTITDLTNNIGDMVGSMVGTERNKESFKPTRCTMPTSQNPYMNWLVGDSPSKPPACVGTGVQEQAANLLNDQLFSDVDDLYSRNANQRLFRTMPNTRSISDNEKFANWLIKNEKGCKTDGWCPPYDDLRLQRQLIPEDLDKNFTITGFNL
jgi:hypothetical protein